MLYLDIFYTPLPLVTFRSASLYIPQTTFVLRKTPYLFCIHLLKICFMSVLTHFSKGNIEIYPKRNALLGRSTQEKDLGVTFSADMKVSEQCGIAASKGNQILGLIRRTITYKEKQLIVPLYKAIVRPHLEYCIQAWRPYRKKDIDKLERIQRRATKMIPELKDLSYESRLLQCGLTTLETRRLRGDQIEVFKIVNSYEDVDRNMFFKLKEGSRTRGHKAALVKEQCRLDMRKYSFSQNGTKCQMIVLMLVV